MTRPRVRVWSVRSDRATAFGRYPSLSTAASTRVRASGLTDGWSFRTRETVATETPAAAATSLMLAIAGPPPRGCRGIDYIDLDKEDWNRLHGA